MYEFDYSIRSNVSTILEWDAQIGHFNKKPLYKFLEHKQLNNITSIHTTKETTSKTELYKYE